MERKGSCNDLTNAVGSGKAKATAAALQRFAVSTASRPLGVSIKFGAAKPVRICTHASEAFCCCCMRFAVGLMLGWVVEAVVEVAGLLRPCPPHSERKGCQSFGVFCLLCGRSVVWRHLCTVAGRFVERARAVLTSRQLLWMWPGQRTSLLASLYLLAAPFKGACC